MSTIAFVTKQEKSGQLPDWAVVLGFSVAGLVVSLVLSVTTSADGLVPLF
jgi:regulatory helix-turn-helix LysR family protein